MRKLAALAALSFLAMQSASADELAILSAAAVRPALIQLPAMVETDLGHKLTVEFGNANQIQKKVVDGARVDVVVLPPRELTALIGHGHLAGDGRFDLGVV